MSTPNLNPLVLAQLRALTRSGPPIVDSFRQDLVAPEEPTEQPAPQEDFIVDDETGISQTPEGEECARCGRTYPGDVGIPEGPPQLAVIEAAAANFWLSMEELKKVRGAAALRNPRDRELVQQVLSEYGYPYNTPPGQALQALLGEVWDGMCASIGPYWTPTPSGWVCPGCAPRQEAGEATTGLGGLTAELNGQERTGDEEDAVDLGELADALGLGEGEDE